MIYFRNVEDRREKYDIQMNYDALEELCKRIAKNCGEVELVRDERKLCHVPRNDCFHEDYDTHVYHYYDEVTSKVSGNKTTEWDHYDEYEVDLYNCQYKDYTCPELVSFIQKLGWSDKKSIDTLFKGDLRFLTVFPTVKEKIQSLQAEIKRVKDSYDKRRKKKVKEMNEKYQSMNQSDFDLGSQLDTLNSWIKKVKKELEQMDHDYEEQMKKLNDQLKYYLSIESLNTHQEDLAPYVVELLGLVQYRLIDSISLDTLKRVSQFHSEKDERFPNAKPKQFVKRDILIK